MLRIIEHMNKRSTFILPLAALLLALTPAAAQAHALGLDSDPNRPVAEYLWLGFLHMVTGYDHLLFIIGILLLPGSLRNAAKLITLFVAGHSLTLLVATIAGVEARRHLVDVVIALSIVFVARRRSARPTGECTSVRRGGVRVRAIHGLGLSTRLQDLGLPDDGVRDRASCCSTSASSRAARRAGHLRRHREPDRQAGAQPAEVPPAQRSGRSSWRGSSPPLVLSFPGRSDDPEPASEAGRRREGGSRPASPRAAPRPTSRPRRASRGGHPAKTFFGPDEEVPETDLGHVVGDGYIIVRYDPDLPTEAQVSELRDLDRGPSSSRYTIAANPTSARQERPAGARPPR